ncbi:RING-H2 finger protein ATL1-like [Lycium ferocissimum]|uniref:RING-H2 finger protein ATL1-like n=1 Tax=Lycium ferocissimum TaxID=112874 RepID=UPI002815D191|nr:RING-H2 finger protein ATL1-like [Lycium ferocissimum]
MDAPRNLHSSSHFDFPIIAIAIIGILATGFLLVTYYIFVIKCCLDWQRIDLLRPFSFSRRERVEDPLTVRSPTPEKRGLDESVIHSIPVFRYKKTQGTNTASSNTCECVVCLNEFQEDENLRVIPNCGHFFHIDCIDIWLQNNTNCPLCRTSISLHITTKFPLDQIITPQRSDNFRDEDYIVIDIIRVQERLNSGELSTGYLSSSPSTTKIEPKVTRKKVNKLSHECIDIRNKDEHFTIDQPIRRSFSMDSASDRRIYEEIMQQQRQVPNVKRSFFSFGHGRGSRNAVLPVDLEL